MKMWLSFVDDEAEPRNVGCCVVEISEAEIDAARLRVFAEFPHAKPGAEAIAAAVSKAWQLGCNPGGEVMAVQIPDDTAVPIGRLMDMAELKARGLA